MKVTAEIRLLPRTGSMDLASLEELTPGGIYACDFAVRGAATWTETPAGYSTGRILNIDHHAATPRWFRHVSSTNLAMVHVRASGAAGPADLVVVDHTDCDSILSAGIVSGRLEPRDEFGTAAIAADHTGAENPIADLLQAIEYRRDLELSFRCLERHVSGRTLEPEIEADPKTRLDERERARSAVERGVIRQEAGGFAWGRNDSDIDAALFPGVLPKATLVLLVRPLPGDPARWECKLRLGPAAPPGLTLFDLQDGDSEFSFGGRWNAGSNKYAAAGSPRGTGVDPERYASALKGRLDRWCEVNVVS